MKIALADATRQLGAQSKTLNQQVRIACLPRPTPGFCNLNLRIAALAKHRPMELCHRECSAPEVRMASMKRVASMIKLEDGFNDIA